MRRRTFKQYCGTEDCEENENESELQICTQTLEMLGSIEGESD